LYGSGAYIEAPELAALFAVDLKQDIFDHAQDPLRVVERPLQLFLKN
jgi:hypothetical protein